MTPSRDNDRTDDCAVVDRIERLAQTWQDLRDRGDASSFEDVCANEPELIPAVKEWLAKVDQMEAKLATHESIGSTLPGSWNADHVLSPAQSPDELGRLGHYRILRLIGQGGMGRVYLAEDMKLERRVAVKVLIRGGDERFQREAKTLARIDHDHIVTIYEMNEERGTHYLAMPYLQGETLDNRLRTRGKLPVADCLRIAKQIAMGLSAAHQHGITHRDIKPSNVWLEKGADRVKILDFGLARLEGMETLLSQENTVVGTPGYMAPEQVQGETADQRSDLFSLGCVLYQMVSGTAPFARKDILSTLRALELETPDAPAVREPGTPEALSSLTMALLAKKPENRPASAEVVVGSLEAIEKDPTRIVADVRPSMLLPVPRTRNPLPWIGAAAVALGFMAAYVAFLPREPGEEKPKDPPPVAAVGPKELAKEPAKEPLKTVPDKSVTLEEKPKSKTMAIAAPTKPVAKYEISVKLPDVKSVGDVLQIDAGRPFQFNIALDDTAYVGVWLWHRSGDGSVTQLFPNEYDTNNRIEGGKGKDRTLPSNKKYQFKMPASKGDDLFLIVASSTNWKWNPSLKTQDGFRVFAKEADLANEIRDHILVDDGKTPLPRSAFMELPVRFAPSDILP